MNRRRFIQTTTFATASATGMTAFSTLAESARKGVNWPIGCFNRPWVKTGSPYDDALKGAKESGYNLVGLLSRTKEEPFIGSDATPEYLEALKTKIARSGLRANMGAIRTKNELPVEDSIKDIRKQIDNAKFLGLEFLLTFGVDAPKYFENYYAEMSDAAAYCESHGIKLVLKPHGGGSGASEEIQRCIAKVNHPNFKIWYDAGNIIYYTGKDPLEQLKPIVQHVTGFCAKDCDHEKGSVWLEFGQGKVDFHAVFAELKKAGYNGPVMVECCAHEKSADATPYGETTASMRRNREFLEKLFASL